MARESVEYNGDFSPTRMDLLLAVFTVFGMPILCFMLYRYTGALIPLTVYYGVFCFALVKWRKQTLDYSTPKHWLSPFFWFFCFYNSFRFLLLGLAMIL